MAIKIIIGDSDIKSSAFFMSLRLIGAVGIAYGLRNVFFASKVESGSYGGVG